MTTPADPSTALDELLAAFLANRASDVARVRDASTMVAAIEARLGTTQAVPRRRTRTLLVVVVAAALVVALLSLLVGGGSRRTSPEASNQLPSAAPGRALTEDHFVSETSLGTIDWTRVPSATPVSPLFEFEGQIIGFDYRSDSWWTSLDGVDWQPTAPPLPGGARDYTRAGDDILTVASGFETSTISGPLLGQVYDRVWVPTREPASLYRRVGATWEAVRVPSIAAPTAKGLRSTGPLFSAPVALSEQDWVLPVGHLIEVPWADLYGRSTWKSLDATAQEADPWAIWDDVNQVLDIFPAGRSQAPLASLTVDLADDASTIEFRDSDSGTPVHAVDATLDGWTPEAMLTALRGWGMEDTVLIVNRAGVISVVRPPWPMGEASDGILAAGGHYYAVTRVIGPRRSVAAVHLWESDDGVTWRQLETPRQVSEPVLDARLFGSADRLVLRVDGADGQSLWTSTDGQTWTRSDIDPEGFGDPIPTDLGWLMAGDSSMAISTDAIEWEIVAIPTVLAGDPVQRVRDLFVVGPGEDRDRYVTWVGRLTGS